MSHSERLQHAMDYIWAHVDLDAPPHRFFEGAAEKFGLDPCEVDHEFDVRFEKPDRDYWYGVWKAEQMLKAEGAE
jgi:hypothetical protein